MNSSVTGLQAGAARADITPQMGIQLAGDLSRYRPTEEVRARTYANALVVEHSGRKICWISADVTGIMRVHADRIRREISAAIGTDEHAVAIHSLQSHSVPFVGSHKLTADCPNVPPEIWWLKGGDERYIDPFISSVVRAACEADERLEPVRLRLGRDYDGRVAFNRRFMLRDGTACMLGQAPREQILCVEGPTDPEVGVALFETESGHAVAAILHHTCHPTHGFPKRWVHPDWPGTWGAQMREVLGEQCLPLVVNGACGNIHHLNLLDPERNDTIDSMASKLTETASLVAEKALPIDIDAIDWKTARFPLSCRNVSPEELDEAKSYLEEHPDPIWLDKEHTSIERDWYWYVAQLDLDRYHAAHPHYEYEIQALRIGPFALVAWPGEPFVEAQLAIKTNAPFDHLFVGHMCNDSAGYIPTREAIERGGYETRPAFTSHLEAGALEKVTEKTKELLETLKAH